MNEQPRKLYLLLNTPELHEPLTQVIGDELLVYDPIHARAHNLSSTTAKIYNACQEGIWDQKSLEAEFGQEVVINTLLELEKAKLILWKPPAKLGRRKFLAAAATVPVISSISVPLPAAAASVACGTTSGKAGCQSLFSNTGGGASGLGPTGCISCCGTSSTAACQTCTSSCSSCNCLAFYVCSDDGVSATPCNATVNRKDICQSGSTDIPGVLSLNCSTLGANGSIFNGLSCSDARTQASSRNAGVYGCCACP